MNCYLKHLKITTVNKMKFYKESDKWYVDLPEWPGERWELEMVCGADTMLDIAAQGDAVTYINADIEPFTSDGLEIISDVLVKIKDTPDIGGALYMLKTFKGIEYNLEVWLCHVLTWLYNENPNIIYIL